nr:reverse transcriptase domain-containing protein [Tanacetum cinerariifolium]
MMVEKVHQEKLQGVQTRLTYDERSRRNSQTREKTQLSESESCDMKRSAGKRRNSSPDTMSRGTYHSQSPSIFSRLRHGGSRSPRRRSPTSTTVFIRLGGRDKSVFTRLKERKKDVHSRLGPKIMSRHKHASDRRRTSVKDPPKTQVTKEERQETSSEEKVHQEKLQGVQTPKTQVTKEERQETSSEGMSHALAKDKEKSKESGMRLIEQTTGKPLQLKKRTSLKASMTKADVRSPNKKNKGLLMRKTYLNLGYAKRQIHSQLGSITLKSPKELACQLTSIHMMGQGTQKSSQDLSDSGQDRTTAMPTWCHMLNSTLRGSQRKYIKDPVEIHHIKQREGESTEAFMERFKAESMHVNRASECMRIFEFMHGITNLDLIKRFNDNIPKQMPNKRHDRFTPLIKTPKEILAMDTVKFKEPPPMSGPAENPKKNKFCEFHGDKRHNTDECIYLRKQIEEAVKSGQLSRLLNEIKQGSHKGEHSKAVKKGETPRKEKATTIFMVQPWQRAPDRNRSIQEEAAKLVEAQIMREVHYHSWLSNPVMEEDSPLTETPVEEKIPEPWILFTDGSSCLEGSGAELFLTNAEGMKFTYALRRLRRYFQAHMVVVITDQPIKQVLSRLENTRRMTKWNFKLAAYDISYRPRTSIGDQVLADFIVERQEEDSPLTETPMEEKIPEPWILFTDGSSCLEGLGAELFLTNAEGMKFTYALRFEFDASNNEAEYEALVAGLRIMKQMGVKNLEAKVDSHLVANKINGSYIAKEQSMTKNLEKAKTLISGFKKFSIEQAQEKVKFLIVSIDHFTKWIEGKAVATITGSQIKNFVWDNILCRFGLPVEIISDNEKQFRDNPFKDCCDKLNIKQRFASVKHLQTKDWWKERTAA